MNGASIHFPDRLRFRGPRGLRTAIEKAAAAQNTTPSEWSRRALLKVSELTGCTYAMANIDFTRSEKQNGSNFNRSSTPKFKTFETDRNSDR